LHLSDQERQKLEDAINQTEELYKKEQRILELKSQQDSLINQMPDGIQKSIGFAKGLGNAIKAGMGPLFLIGAVLALAISSFVELDESAKEFRDTTGMTNSQMEGIRSQANEITGEFGNLGIKSKNVLKAALQKFGGTLLLVSHDRDFLQGMSNIVYEFKDQKIKEYLGDINYFLEQRNLENMREVEKKDSTKKEVLKENKKVSYEDQKKGKTLHNKLSKIESQIQQLEREIQEADKLFASNYDKYSEDASFFTAYTKKKADLDQLLLDWEIVQEEIENLN
jgi:ATP-binding cassette subfamily F protein 3